jgi:phage terminase large subunit
MILNHPVYESLYTDTTHPIILITGGRGSGKSFGVSTFVERMTFEKKPYRGNAIVHQILYTRYTMVSAAISIIPEFIEKTELDGTEKFFMNTKQDVINRWTGSHIMFRGIKTSSGNQTAKLKSIHGITTFVCDEAEEWTSERDFETILYSIRQKGIQNRVIIIMNPTDNYHWVYQRFIKNTHKIEYFDGVPVQISTHPDVLHIHTTYLDNLSNLSDEFIKSAESTKEENQDKYAHLFMGQWSDVAEGAVFKNVHECKEFPQWAEHVAIGLDFGYSNDPTAAVLCGVVDNSLYMKEIIYKKGLIAKDIAKELLNYDLPIYCDQADPRLIDELHLLGLNTYAVPKGAGSIIAGIDKMLSMDLYVTSDSMNILNEFHNYVWDKDKDGNYINKPVDRDNHACDAIRYFVNWKLLGHNNTP